MTDIRVILLLTVPIAAAYYITNALLIEIIEYIDQERDR